MKSDFKKPKMLFISKGNANFIQNDRDLLSQQYDIKHFIYPDKPGIINLYLLTQLLLFCLWHNFKAKLTFVWFADFHTVIPTLLSRVFRKRSILIIGGYDAAKLPDLSYGAHCNAFRSKCIDLSCQWASEVIVVSQFVRKHLLKNTSGNFSTKLLYNAIPKKSLSFNDKDERPYVCTVCPSNKINRYLIKGIDVFIKCAKLLPNIPFLIIGPQGELLKKIESVSSNNILIITKLPHQRFIELLKEVRIICQFSRYESFGMSLLEGMQMGGLPISSNDIGTSELLPEKSQHTININNIEEAANLIKHNYDTHPGPYYYSKYVNEHFNLQERHKNLISILRSPQAY